MPAGAQVDAADRLQAERLICSMFGFGHRNFKAMLLDIPEMFHLWKSLINFSLARINFQRRHKQ